MVRKKGIMLVSVLLVTTILLLLLISSLNMTSSQSLIMSVNENSEAALMGAELAVDRAFTEISRKVEYAVEHPDEQDTVFDAVSREKSEWIVCYPFDTAFPNAELRFRYGYDSNTVFGEGAVFKRDSSGNLSPVVRRAVLVNWDLASVTVAANGEVGFLDDMAASGSFVENANIHVVYSARTQYPMDAFISCSKIAPEIAYAGTQLQNIPFNTGARTDGTGYAECISAYPTTSGAINLLVGLRLQKLNQATEPVLDIYFGDLDNVGEEEIDEFCASVPYWDPGEIKEISTSSTPVGSALYLKDSSFGDKQIMRDCLYYCPLSTFVYCNGDLILENGSTLLVTGNLFVNGNIKGKGNVVVMGSLIVAPTNRSFEDSYTTTPVNRTRIEDPLLIYANQRILMIGAGVSGKNVLLHATMPYALYVRVKNYCRSKNFRSNSLEEMLRHYYPENKAAEDVGTINWIESMLKMKG